MKIKRLVTALLIALLISGLFTFWLSTRVSRAAHVTRTQKQVYVAAGRALDAGETLKPESLELVEWHAATPLAEGFTKVSDLNGRVLRYPLAKGEPIIERQLAVAGAGAGLTANIPSGMRAISVRSDEVMGVAGFLLPGTHVDVLMTYRSSTSPDPRTATVLQDVVVLGAGQQIHPDPSDKPVIVDVVTLLLKPEDAERLVLATTLGSIHFVLRNGADQEQLADPSIGISELTGAPDLLPGTAPKTPQPNVRRYKVETFLGDKQVVSSFR
jgi:pilus assembly protein CpaB